MRRIALFFMVMWTFMSYASFTTPDAKLTPGKLCTPSDRNFKGYDYEERVARCNRNVSRSEKMDVAAAYGNIPTSEWPKYEFDHLIPLCAGGSNDPENLWPQPIDEAHKKDQLENDVCLAMQAGTLTQSQAVQKMEDWFNSTAQKENPADTAHVSCRNKYGVTVRFNIVERGWISNVSVNIEDNDGEHEAFHTPRSLVGKSMRDLGSYRLANYNQFALSNNKESDTFYIYLPQNILPTTKDFVGYLRLSKIYCVQ